MPLQYSCPDKSLSYARYQRFDRAVGLGFRYLLSRKGPGSAPFWSICVFEALRGGELPELQIYFTPMVVRESGLDDRDLDVMGGSGGIAGLLEVLGHRILVRGKRAIHGFQLDINQMRPDACGEVRLASNDPFDRPVIDPRFLSERKEVHELIEGVRRAREIVAQDAMTPARGIELSPGDGAESDTDIEAAIRATVTTGHHPVGTCKMGADSDPFAVLDGELRVRGVEGLRVVDASVFPNQITGNTTAPVLMVAEKAADMIKGLPVLAPEDPEKDLTAGGLVQ